MESQPLPRDFGLLPLTDLKLGYLVSVAMFFRYYLLPQINISGFSKWNLHIRPLDVAPQIET